VIDFRPLVVAVVALAAGVVGEEALELGAEFVG
jgi:hypothetical protein